MGCPYSSEVAISEKNVAIDEALLGSWESKSSTDYTYTVTKQDKMTYTIEKKSASSGDITTYNGFITKIGGINYLNIFENSTTVTYYFYKFTVSSSGAKVTLTPVTENITEKFTESSELKKFFEDNQKHSFFFDKDEDVYIKN